jgi:cardiolipin synthase (CMP-forming)
MPPMYAAQAALASTRGPPLTCGVRRPPLFSLPNLLSLARFPLAAAFLATNAAGVRVALIGAASLTDVLDGWLARRQQPTRLGAILDPIADKTFMLAALSAFLVNGAISTGAYFLILSRDIATAIGFLVAYVLPGLDPRSFRARKPGKVVTILQLIALLVLVLRPALLPPLLWPIAAASLWAIADYTVLLSRERVRS